MKTFTDAAGRTWSISVNLGTALKVKDSLGVDLLQPEQGDPPLLTRLGTDELLLGQVICCLLSDQIEAHKVTEADVRAGFDGQTLLAAQTAFLTAGTVALAVLDQKRTVTGAQGPLGDFSITNFSRNESLEEAIVADVTAKLARFEEWHEVPAA